MKTPTWSEKEVREAGAESEEGEEGVTVLQAKKRGKREEINAGKIGNLVMISGGLRDWEANLQSLFSLLNLKRNLISSHQEF